MTHPQGEHIPAYATTEPGAIVFIPVDENDLWDEDEIYAFLDGGNALEGPITAGLETAFHLPGQHDQSTHGSGHGVTGHDALDAPTIRFDSDGKVHGGYLQPEEVQALGSYRNTGYIRINDYLRGKTPIRPEDTADAAVKAAAMKTALAKSTIKQKITTERGTRSDHWLPREFQDGKGNLTGLEFRDAGFVSTTARVGGGRRFAHTGGVVMHITSPPGTHAMTISDFGDEAEILLDSGLIYRVTHDAGMIDGVRHLDVEVVM